MMPEMDGFDSSSCSEVMRAFSNYSVVVMTPTDVSDDGPPQPASPAEIVVEFVSKSGLRPATSC